LGGGGVVSRFSSEAVEGGETCGKRDEGAEDVGSEMIVEDRDLCAAQTWSFNIDISTLASYDIL
jgi:hypothetical protein